MRILIKIANKNNISTLYKLRNFFLNRNDLISKKAATLIDNTIDKIFKRETINLKFNLNLNNILKSNPQFKMLSNDTYLVPTRNLIYFNRYSGIKDNKSITSILDEMDNIYQKIINRICLLAYTLNVNNPIELMALYYTLYNYNFISYDFIKDDEMYHDIEKCTKDNLGYNILLGHAVCRHHTIFFRDLCLRYGYNAKAILSCVIENGEEQFYGHAFTEVKFEGITLYLDSLNGLSFYYDEKNHLVFEKNKYFAKDKFLFRYKASLMGLHQIPTLKKDTIDINNFKYLFKKAVNFFEEDEAFEILKQFAVDNYYYLEKMSFLAYNLRYEILRDEQKKLKKTRK